MGTFSIWHWLIVLAVVLVLFGGGGKLSRLMADFGKGLKSFKNNIKEDKNSDSDAAEKTTADRQATDPKIIDATVADVGEKETSTAKVAGGKD